VATQPVPINGKGDYYSVFSDLTQFAAAVETATGASLDFESLLSLNTNFVEATEQYLLLNLKEEEPESDGNNILVLRGEWSYVYTRHPPKPEEFRQFEKLYSRPFGRSTVLAFLVLSKIGQSYKARLDTLGPAIRDLDTNFDQARYRELLNVHERLTDRIEDFHELLVRLQERSFKQIETRYLSFDYNVLLTEAQALLDRLRRRLAYLRELARDQELKTATELNRRIEHLSVVVRRLTALTVIISAPTLIASHFGMNFLNMPELGIAWAYPLTIIGEIAAIVGGILWFRKVGWL